MSLGLYISVPFCRSKCSYCNFASGVFDSAHMPQYVARVCADIASCRALLAELETLAPAPVDSIYLGGGTPSLLPPAEWAKLFMAIAREFDLASEAEITVECAPGTLTQPILESLVSSAVNRVSLGVQSFVNQEAAAVGRLHTRAQVLDDIRRLREVGIANINIDLIAGLPHQSSESWAFSVDEVIATGVPHVSIYMLEVDEDSRLGRELMAGGIRYHAHFVPDEDLTAEFYEAACEKLNSAGIAQYEISNFARAGSESRHNLKYWTRQPYLGFGVDAHSMLPVSDALLKPGIDCIRLATTDSLDEFLVSQRCQVTTVSKEEALEESFFLGLRLNRGVRLDELEQQHSSTVAGYAPIIDEMISAGLLIRTDDRLRLTQRGRLLSNEVFVRFVGMNNQETKGPLSAPLPAEYIAKND